MSGIATIILWTHAIAALLIAGVALSRLRDARNALPRVTFVTALAITALWALAVAGIGATDAVTPVAEAARDLAWLSFMYALGRQAPDGRRTPAITMIYGVLALLVLAGAGLAIFGHSMLGKDYPDLATLRAEWRTLVALGALVLVCQLYAAVAPRARGGIRLVVLALAAMWSVDLLLSTAAFAGAWEDEMTALRGIVLICMAPLLTMAVHRNGDWTLQLSRTVAWQSLTFVVTLLYVFAMQLGTGAIARVSGDQARLWQTAFVFGFTATGLTLLSSPRIRAWAKVKISKHFFRHRYDYRTEWIRFTDTLGKPEGAAPLDQRIVKAVADLTDSPAGLLLVPDGTGLGIGMGWNWQGPSGGADARLVAHLTTSARIIELDTVRANTTDPDEAASIPVWMLTGDAWAVVPLPHLDRLQGAIVLARPPLDRALDWEDFDLLRIAGRQVASYLAEARAQEALAGVVRFDEFNRRFAFIMHDIKNLVSQLALVTRNAERHAHNPDFRVDMIATLKDSVGRMNDLLARLSQHRQAHGEEVRPTGLLALAERLAQRTRAQHPVTVTGAADVLALADPARVEQLLGHLLQNAIEASPPGTPVTITVDAAEDGVSLTVIDHGIGMTPTFVRDQLFKPFVSTKPGGFGIGAFEVKQLAEAMGGSVAVESEEGSGTTFRITFPAARADSLEQAA